MNTDFPVPITSIDDLEIYENYLKEEFRNQTAPTKNLKDRLKTLIGSLVKIDYPVGNRLESKIGRLLEIGEDFISINLQNGRNMVIGLNTVKFLTVLQNNIKNPHF